MEILNRRHFFHTFLTLVSVFVFLSGEIKGQVVVTNPTNTTPNLSGTYTSLNLALTDLVGKTINGPITITLTGNETAPLGGYIISAQGSAANTITIQGSGSTITAPTPQNAGILSDGIFKIIGGDYITIQNFTMVENPANTENNQGTNNMTEWGVALLYANTTNGAKNNTIQNNLISLSSSYANSVAVYSNVRHAAGTPLAQGDITLATGNNSGNKVYGNTISNVACPVIFVGSPTTDAMDGGNEIGGSSAGTGNTITAWGNNAANTGAFPLNALPYTTTPTIQGIFCANQLDLNIGYNTLTGNPLATAIALRGIYVSYLNSPTSRTFTQNIANNTITLSNSVISTYEVIRTDSISNALVTATLNINSNSILNCAVKGGFTGIRNSSITKALNINSNIILGTVSGSVNQNIYGILNTGGATAYINIKNNQLGNNTGDFIKYTGASSGELRVISNEATTTPNTSTLYISGNRIQGIDQTTVAGSNLHNYIYNLYPAKFQNIDSNIFTRISANTTGSIYFINNSVSIQANGIQNVSYNSIGTGGFAKTAGSGTVYLYYAKSGVKPTSKIVHENNNFSKITLTGTTAMQGWRATSADLPSFDSKVFRNNIFSNWICGSGQTFVIDVGTGAYTISNNIITDIKTNGDLKCINTSNIANSNALITKNTIGAISNTNKKIVGIYCLTPTATISKNKIYDVSNSNTFPRPVTGIYINNPTCIATLTNNYVGDIKTTNADHDHAVQGIYSDTVNILNVYNNTVWLNASQNRVAAFGSSAIYVVKATQTNFFNNIFVNMSTPKNRGDVKAYSVAYRRGSPISATNYTGNNNLFYAGIPDSIHFIYLDSTTSPPSFKSDETLDRFKRRLKVLIGIPDNLNENASITEYPPFLSTVGTDPDFLHINNACVSPPTYIESGGRVISVITDDFDGDLRWGQNGYLPAGLGAAPDIGADEFNSQSVVVISSAGVVTTPTSYNTLKAAFAKINDGTHQGVITMKLYCSTVEKGTAVLNPPTGSASYSSVVIYPAVPGLSISNSADSTLIELNGATNLTIDGRVNQAGLADLSIIHTGTSVVSRNILFQNSARNNTIKYCKINGQCPDPVSGVVYFSPSSSTPGNDNNLIDHCEFSNSGTRPLNVIFSDGVNGRDNAFNTISNNSFYNFLNPSAASNGIFIREFSTDWTITGNSFYENTSFTPTLPLEYSAIRILNTYGGNFTISGNFIGGSAGQCTGGPFTKVSFTSTFYGIYFSALNANASSIQGNTIRNFSWTNSAAANWTGIYVGGSGVVNIGNITGNTIGSATGTGSIFVDNGNTYNVEIVGIRHEGAGTGLIRNNTIGSITSGHASAFSASIYGILKSAGAGAVTISDNNIGSAVTANSINATSVSNSNAQLVYGICNTTSAGCTISGNTIGNLTNACSTTGTVGGISLSGSSTNVVSKNFIHSLKSISPTIPIYGINIAAGTGTYSNNIVSLGNAVTSGSAIYGISEYTASASNVYFNTVYIGGAVSAGTNNTWGIYSGNSNTRDFRDNIFHNSRSGGGNHYAIGLANKTGLSIDYNDYYSTNSILGQYNGANQATIVAWKIVTTQDVHSVSLDPLFPGAGGTVESGYLPAVALSGITIPTFTTDYNSVTRATTPTMGALESVAIATTTLTPSTVCTNNTLNVCFSSTGTFAPGNVFTAQLSDISGNFSSPTDLLPKLTSNATGNQCINVLIPAGTVPGAGYRIRVVSSTPANTTDAGLTIEVHQSSTLSVNTKTDVTCSGLPIGAIDLKVTGGTPVFNYLWTTTDGIIPVGQSTNQDLTGLVAGTYKVTMSGNFGCVSTLSVPIVVSTLPAIPTLAATLPCVGNNNTTFTAGNGSKYQFFFNGVSQGSPSATNTFTRTSALVNNDMVCVRSFWPFNFDGKMDEPSWGAPLATSIGGPATSSFGDYNHIDAIYIKSDPDYLFGGIAGNLGDNSGNRILLFIDSKTGGYNNIGAWSSRSNSPCRSIENLNNGITFDSGFDPDYILAINQATGGLVYYDLYDMAGNSNNFLGTQISSSFLGFTASTGYTDYTDGFEFAIPLSALGSPVGNIKVFAMITNNPAPAPPTTLSNQFLTRAGAAQGSFGSGGVTFGSEPPDPIGITLSDIDCYSETCITIKTVAAPTADNVTVCFDGLPHSATASTPHASIAYYAASSGGSQLGGPPTGTAFGTYSAWAEATDSTSLCVSARTQVTLTIKKRPAVTPVSNRRYCNNEGAPLIPFTATPAGGTFAWTSSSDVGFGTDGTGDIPASTATNGTNAPVLAVINVSVTAVNGCASLPVSFNDTVFPSPRVNTTSNKAYCNGDAAPAIYFSSPTSGTVHYNWSSDIGASGVDSIVFAPVNITPDPIVSTVTVIASVYGCSGPTSNFTITINPSPHPTIVTDYCSVPNKLKLTAEPQNLATYRWSPTVSGYTTPTITVDQAGNFGVVVTNSGGCQGSAYLNLGTELVTDGSFTNFIPFVPSFFSEYIQSPEYYDGTNDATGLIQPNKYAVDINAWSNPPIVNGYHPFFHGRDHTNNTVGQRNFMMVNGSDSLVSSPAPAHPAIIWQQTVDVLYRRNYYFSAWAMNLSSTNNARLQFEINGHKVGTILDLATSPKPTTEAQVDLSNWNRFYNDTLWTPPAGVTKAVIRIVNLTRTLDGNNFGLDDISFGVLASIPDASSAAANGGGTVCVGDDLNFTVNNLHGGTLPYHYEWKDPANSVISTDSTAFISNAQPGNSGDYTLVVTDANGCKSLPAKTYVNVIPFPVKPTEAKADRTAICSNDFGTINLSVVGGSGSVVRWYANDCGIAGTFLGLITPPSQLPPIPAPLVTTTYYARWETDCDNSACEAVTVTVGSKWTGAAGLNWDNPGNWDGGCGVPDATKDAIIPNVANKPIVNITTAACRNLTIDASATLDIVAGQALTVNNNLINNGALTVSSSALNNNGSLIVLNTSSGSGSIAYNRYLETNRWFITSPSLNNSFALTNGSTIGQVGSTVNIAPYTEFNNAGWDYLPAIPATLTEGVGYLVKLSEGNTVQYSGALNGDLSLPVASSGSDDGWNAIGNPYTSALRIVDELPYQGFITQNLGTLDDNYRAVYVWNETGPPDQYYKVICNVGYGGKQYGGVLADKYVQAGQGFLVNIKYNGGTAGTILFKKGTSLITGGMQVHAPGSTFLKSSQTNTSWPGITLLASGNGKTGSTVIAFNSNMTTGLDPSYDAGMLSATDFNVYTHLVDGSNQTDFMVQCLPDSWNDTLAVPIGVDLPTAGQLTFKTAGVILPDGLYPVIEDRLLQLSIPLKTENDSLIIGMAEPTWGIGRFYLHIGGELSTVGNSKVNDSPKLSAYFSDQKITVSGLPEKGSRAWLCDMSGRVLGGEYSLTSANRNEISAEGLASGIYLLRIEGKSSRQILKITVLNR